MHLLSTLATIKTTRHCLMNRSMVVGGKTDAINVLIVININSRTESFSNVVT